jgi:DNA mismatch repair protein MutL
VRDRALSKAVLEAYRAAGGGERGFDAFVFVDVPPHMVDVNVHPAKTEVRFAEARTVWTAVERGVREALSQGARTAPRVEVGGARGVAERAQAAVLSFLDRAAAPPVPAAAGWTQAPPDLPRVAEGSSPSAAVSVPDADLPSAGPAVLGQHRLTYIVASDGDELLLVDQHTAHERVRFETLVEGAERRLVESQGLLTPAIVDLPPDLRPVLEAHAEALGELGFDVEPFGGGATRVRAVPAVLGTRDPGPALERILRDLEEREDAEWAVSGTRDRLAATLACHSAVRAGQPLNAESMAKIVRDLFRAAHPTLCPHGRPTVVRLPREELSRWFGRTGWRRQ